MSVYVLGQIVGTRPKRKLRTPEQKAKYGQSRKEYMEQWKQKMRHLSACVGKDFDNND